MKYSILSHEEAVKIYYDLPYIYELTKGKKKLIVFGAGHIADPSHIQYKKFRDLFKKLKPDAVFVESWSNEKDWSDFKSENDIIKVGGESTWLVYCAQKNKIPAFSWDLPYDKEIKLLLEKYSKKLIFAKYILRNIPYLNKYKLETQLQNRINQFRNASNWKGFDYSIDNLKKIHYSLFKKEIDFSNHKFYLMAPYPFKNDSILNKISRDASIERDKHGVKTILGSFKKYNKIIAIMGSTHAVMQEPAYKDYFN